MGAVYKLFPSPAAHMQTRAILLLIRATILVASARLNGVSWRLLHPTIVGVAILLEP